MAAPHSDRLAGRRTPDAGRSSPAPPTASVPHCPGGCTSAALGSRCGTSAPASASSVSAGSTRDVSIGFDSAAADKITWSGMFTAVSPLETAVSALEKGMALRCRRIYVPDWVGGLVHLRVPRMTAALAIARTERARSTTALPDRTR